MADIKPAPDYRLGHRDRLRQKFVDAKTTEEENLELLLMNIIPRCDVKPIARNLLREFGGVFQIISAPIEDLIKIKGIGKNCAIQIKIHHAIMLAGYRTYLKDTPVFHDISRVSDYCRMLLMGKAVEHFYIFYLDKDHRLICEDLHSVGTIDWTAVHPREILKRALNLNAHAVMMLHNHPTSNSAFSSPDVEATQAVIDMLRPTGVNFFDHLLVTQNGIVHQIMGTNLVK